MNLILWVGPAAVGLGLGAVAAGLVGRSSERRTSFAALQSIVGGGIDTRQAELAAPLSQRLLGPVGQSLTKIARAVTPGTMVARLRQNTSLAGLGSLGVEGALALKTAGAALMALIFPLGLALIGVGVGNVVLLGFIGAAIGFMLPDVFIAQRGRKRQAEIRKALPETLDLLAIAVGAGMGLEAAIELVIQRLPGALGQEFYRILQELSLGVARREAFGSLRTRTEVDELSTFALILTQADALGTPLSVVLKSQAAEMRMLRRQRAREQGAKTPVALLFPLLLGIFPALMLVVIGPAVISIMKAFSGGHA
jgi:tight adherence protein C